jgi:3',5'-cyclic AMP phosphodiesterase CpdA
MLFLVGCSHTPPATSVSTVEENKDLTFFVTNDIHYLAKNFTEDSETFNTFIEEGDGKELLYIDDLLEAFIRDIRLQSPDFLIVSGDLTTNGEKESHQALAEKFKAIEALGTSVYVIPGNHDIDNPWALKFQNNERYFVDTITGKEFNTIYNDFGYSEAISRDKETLSYLVAPAKHTWLLMLDTNKYTDNQKKGYPEAGGELKKNTLEWIQECHLMAKEKEADIIVVMHHNLLDHSNILNDNFTIDHKDTVLEAFAKADLHLALTGHVHIQDIVSHEIKTDDQDVHQFIDIATSAFSVYPQNYGILKYHSEKGTYDYQTRLITVEEWARELELEDPVLLNFNHYAYHQFADKAYHMAYRRIKDLPDYSDTEKDLMATYFMDLNLKYFAGSDTDVEDILKSPGYKLWQTAPDNFLKHYILSLQADEDIDDNHLEGILLNMQNEWQYSK